LFVMCYLFLYLYQLTQTKITITIDMQTNKSIKGYAELLTSDELNVVRLDLIAKAQRVMGYSLEKSGAYIEAIIKAHIDNPYLKMRLNNMEREIREPGGLAFRSSYTKNAYRHICNAIAVSNAFSKAGYKKSAARDFVHNAVNIFVKQNPHSAQFI